MLWWKQIIQNELLLLRSWISPKSYILTTLFLFVIFSSPLDAKKVANTNWTTWQEAQTNAKRKNQPKKILDTTRKDSSQITGQLFKATLSCEKGFSRYFHPVTEFWCRLSWRNGAYFHIGWQDPTSLPAKNDW